MAAHFVDSSALVKRYIQETGTPWVRGLTHRRAGHDIFIARIAIVEVTSAVARRRGGKAITPAQASTFLSRFREHVAGRYTVLEITPGLVAAAATLANRHALRAYDAVQLAAALEILAQRQAVGLAPVTLVSADRDLNAAAAAEGLPVENPNSHP